MLYASSKSDVRRLDEVARFTGVGRTPEMGARLLDLTNRVWRTNTAAARFVSDTMVACWLDNRALHSDIPSLLSEPDQYRLLAWYCCIRPLDSGCEMSSEPVDPILQRMAREIVAESPQERLPYTALMMSIYHFRPDVRDAVMLRGAGRPSFLGWYYAHGIRELAIIHHVGGEEWAALNAVGDDALTPLCRFALEWLPHPPFDLGLREERAKAQAWFAQSSASAEPFASLAGDLQRHAAGDAGTVQHNGGETTESGAKYAVEWQIAEYFDRRGGGGRLLYHGEWFPVEGEFSWSRVPWASLILRLPAPFQETVNIGLLLHATEDMALQPDRELTIYVNGVASWSGVVRDAAGRELVLRVPRQHLRGDTVNLLQFNTPEPFVPSEAGTADDTRRLGVPLRRLWVNQPGGRPPDAAVAGTPRRARIPARPLPQNDLLLVLRGDLLSHTGYAKEARALAALVPPRFRTLGVDIHPDPADNRAAFPHPVVPEPEALQQVADQPRRCVVVHCSAPDDFAVWPNARNVGWPSWETDAIPYLRDWPLRIGLMDAIWAKTRFMAEFVRRAGFKGPVHAVAWPHEFTLAGEPPPATAGELWTQCVDHFGDAWRATRPCLMRDLRSDARLLFLAVQSMAPRKGLPLLLSEWRAHVAGSGADDMLVLRLAFRHATDIAEGWEVAFRAALSTAGFRHADRVRIAVIPEAVSETELTGLYRAADAFVSMTYGEGFGGPIVEALQNECPVIAPRHTGLCDMLPEDYPLAVASTRMAVALKGNLPNYPHSATWYVPKPGELRRHLAAFAAMPAARRRALLEDCRKYAMSFCWMPVVRHRLAAALDDLAVDQAADTGLPRPANSEPRHAAP